MEDVVSFLTAVLLASLMISLLAVALVWPLLATLVGYFSLAGTATIAIWAAQRAAASSAL